MLPNITNPDRQTLLDIANFNVTFKHGKGPILVGTDGNTYLDFASQFGVHPFGHNPDFLKTALEDFIADEKPNLIQPFYSDTVEKLAEKLVSVAPNGLRYVFFSNSGAEAVEVALKLARYSTGRMHILSAKGGFHGKTNGAAYATGTATYRDGLFPESQFNSYVEFNNCDGLVSELRKGIYAAFILEIIQGEGGVNPATSEYLKVAEAECRSQGTLLIIDEIQTGLGRTGELFACTKYELTPDIMLLSKALGGGIIPIGATLYNDRAYKKTFGLKHSSTFANGRLASGVALSVLNKICSDDTLLPRIRELGNYLQKQLDEVVRLYPAAYYERSGYGLMQGIKLRDWHDEAGYLASMVSHMGLSVPIVCSYLAKTHGIIVAPTLSSASTIRIQPCYDIKIEHIDSLIVALKNVGRIISESKFYKLFDNCVRVVPKFGNKRTDCRNSTESVAHPAPSDYKLGTFAFLIHPTSDVDLLNALPFGDEIYDSNERKQIIEWFTKAKSIISDVAPAYYLPCIRSKEGGYVDGWLIASFQTPEEMIRSSRQSKENLMKSYIETAKHLDASIVGLGAFTSVISRSGTMVADYGIPITTGNSLTALSCTEAMNIYCARKELSFESRIAAVVGASGSVGRLISLDYSRYCARLFLFGNPKNKDSLVRLEELAGEICRSLLNDDGYEGSIIRDRIVSVLSRNGNETAYRFSTLTNAKLYKHIKSEYENEAQELFPISLETDIDRFLPLCNVVFTATSNGEEFINSENIGFGSIVCDAAIPSDISASLDFRTDVTAFKGGEVCLPEKIRFGRSNILNFESGVNLACLSETIALCMEGVTKHYSIGGCSSYEEALEVISISKRHGFEPFLKEIKLNDPHGLPPKRTTAESMEL